jgi:hypothetical protein
MTFVPKKLRYTMMLISLSAAVAACGGGGGGGGSSGGTVGTSPEGADVDGGYAVLTWEAPVTREDGECLSDLAAYRISYGLAPGVYDKAEVVNVSEMSSSETGRTTECGSVKSYTFLVENLDTASWYFAVQAVDTAGKASAYSNEVVKTVQ